MYRPDYHRATRIAYRTLLATGVDTLPVDAAALCARCRNTKVKSFSEARHECDEFEPLCDGPSRMAFTMRRTHDGITENLVFWNDEEMSPGSGLYRFSLAHELGHIVMKHTEDAGYVVELEANVFAQHLLCPRPVLEVLQPEDWVEVMHLCCVSQEAAQIALTGARQANRYMDADMWQGIFEAFELDEKRNLADHLSPAAAVALRVHQRRREYA